MPSETDAPVAVLVQRNRRLVMGLSIFLVIFTVLGLFIFGSMLNNNALAAVRWWVAPVALVAMLVATYFWLATWTMRLLSLPIILTLVLLPAATIANLAKGFDPEAVVLCLVAPQPVLAFAVNWGLSRARWLGQSPWLGGLYALVQGLWTSLCLPAFVASIVWLSMVSTSASNPWSPMRLAHMTGDNAGQFQNRLLLLAIVAASTRVFIAIVNYRSKRQLKKP